MNAFLTNLNDSKDKQGYWDERVQMLMLESAVVHRDKSITLRYYNDFK